MLGSNKYKIKLFWPYIARPHLIRSMFPRWFFLCATGLHPTKMITNTTRWSRSATLHGALLPAFHSQFLLFALRAELRLGQRILIMVAHLDLVIGAVPLLDVALELSANRVAEERQIPQAPPQAHEKKHVSVPNWRETERERERERETDLFEVFFLFTF